MYPYESWRTPTSSEIKTLTDSLHGRIYPKGYDNTHKIGWIFHQYTSTPDAYGGKLYFNGFGTVGDDGGLQDQIMTVSNGYYRSTGSANNQSVYYLSSNNNPTTPIYMYFQNFYNAFSSSLDANYNPGTFNSSQGMSIRCVKK